MPLREFKLHDGWAVGVGVVHTCSVTLVWTA